MQAKTKLNPLKSFLQLSCCDASVTTKDQIRYRFSVRSNAEYFEGIADQLIIKNALPLTAHLEVWSSRGVVRETAVVIMMAPEGQTVADEVPDTEGLNGGWWDKNEE